MFSGSRYYKVYEKVEKTGRRGNCADVQLSSTFQDSLINLLEAFFLGKLILLTKSLQATLKSEKVGKDTKRIRRQQQVTWVSVVNMGKCGWILFYLVYLNVFLFITVGLINISDLRASNLFVLVGALL